MITLNILEQITADQQQYFKAKGTGLKRDIKFQKYLNNKQIVVISGIRRSGKSTLLRQFADVVSPYYYLTLDDERLLNFEVSDFANLMIAFKKSHEAKTIFLDEIQNVSGWERFARRLYEEGYKIFITGSNAKLLSSELTTHLTGRYFKIELYPFSFKEFLNFEKINYQDKSSENTALILKKFDEYLLNGGFPEMVTYKDKEFVKRIYEDVLFRDIIARFKIKESKSFQQLANYLFSNTAKEVSYNALKNILGIKSAMSIKKYIGFMEEAYLLFEVFKYDFSLSKQFTSNKKIFAIDTGMQKEVAFSFSENKGRALENIIFIELKRRGLHTFFFKGKRECDFIIQEKNKITAAIQVTTALSAHNKQREILGLVEALEASGLSEGTILTLSQEEIIRERKYTLMVVPAWKWLLEK